MDDDDGIRARYERAMRATRELEDTFEVGPVGRMLSKGPDGSYLIADADVPKLFFHEGRNADEDIGAFIRANGDPIILEDYAGDLAKEAALDADGTFDVVRLDRWTARYASAISMLPGLKDRLAAARAAKIKVHEAILERERKLREFKEGPAGLFLEHDPATATTMLFDLPDTEGAMRSLMAGVTDDAMLSGLRAAVRDHVSDQVRASNDRAEAYLAFLTKNRAALSILFAPSQMATFDAIGADLKRTTYVDLHPEERRPAPAPLRLSWWRRLLG